VSDRRRAWVATFSRRGFKLILGLSAIAYILLQLLLPAFHFDAARGAIKPFNLAAASLIVDDKIASASSSIQCERYTFYAGENLHRRFENCLKVTPYGAGDAFLRCWTFFLLFQDCYAVEFGSALLQDKALQDELYARIKQPCILEARFEANRSRFTTALSNLFFARPDVGPFYAAGTMCDKPRTLRFVVDFVDAESGKVVDRHHLIVRTEDRRQNQPPSGAL
jgi:hypothetical protein